MKLCYGIILCELGVPSEVTENELCGRYPALNRSFLNHAKRNVAIPCPSIGVEGKYMTITSSSSSAAEPWSINEILVQSEEMVQEYSDVYGEHYTLILLSLNAFSC